MEPQNRFTDPSSRSFVSMFIIAFGFLIGIFLTSVSAWATSTWFNLASFVLMLVFLYSLLFFLGHVLGGYLTVIATCISGIAGIIDVMAGFGFAVMMMLVIGIVLAIFAQEKRASHAI